MAPRDIIEPYGEPVAETRKAPPARPVSEPLIPTGCVLIAVTLLVDMAALCAAGLLIVMIAPVHPEPQHLAALLPVCAAIFAFGGLYHRETWETDELRRIAAGLGLLVLVAVVPGLTRHDTGATAALLWLWPLALVLVVGGRMGLRASPWIARLSRTHLVLAGLGIERDTLAYQMRESCAGPVNVVRGVPLSVLKRLGREGLGRWLDRLAARQGIPVRQLQVVIVPAPQERQSARQVTDWLGAGGHPFAIAISGGVLARRGVGLKRFLGSDTVLAGTAEAPRSLGSHRLKRVIDIGLSSIALVVLAPLLGLISLGLMLEGGAVFFTQIRVGAGHRRFACLKFRTMLPDAEARLQQLLHDDPEARAEWHRTQKLRRDPRITPLGRLLRASSLDELPQLLNILRGDMSLVGPRPVIAPEVPGYPADRAYYSSAAFADYASCVPGLTGLWQVAGRHETAHSERVRLDQWYARNRTVWLDLVIICRTVRVVLLGKGG